MLDKFQTSTVHALESSFVNAIEKLGSVLTSSSDSDKQSKFNQLLLENDNLLKEKENLIKSSKPPYLKEIKRELCPPP